jgi:hypothetical protein
MTTLNLYELLLIMHYKLKGRIHYLGNPVSVPGEAKVNPLDIRQPLEACFLPYCSDRYYCERSVSKHLEPAVFRHQLSTL